MRFLEVVDYGDGTGAVYATVIDFIIEPGDIAEAGRFYSLLDVQEGRSIDSRRGSVITSYSIHYTKLYDPN